MAMVNTSRTDKSCGGDYSISIRIGGLIKSLADNKTDSGRNQLTLNYSYILFCCMHSQLFLYIILLI